MVKIKYKEWLYQWLENYVKPSCKERTYQRYRIATEQHLIPVFGDVFLLQMEPMTVQRFLTGELQNGNIRDGKGLSASTVNLLISVIQNSMKTAYEIGLVDSYTMNRLKRPKVKEKQVECFSVAEQKMIESAVIADKRSKMFGVLFCLYTGVRIGELLALEWDDVNFAAGEITVNKPYDSDWCVPPVTNIEAFLGSSALNKQYMSKIPTEFMQKKETSYGIAVCKIQL